MKFNRDLKVEITLDDRPYSDYRAVFYRVVPSELPLFKRWFCNPWRQFYHGLKLFSGTFDRYDKDRYYNEVAVLKTWGDVCDYLKEQDEIIGRSGKEWEKERAKRIKNHEMWPDE